MVYLATFILFFTCLQLIVSFVNLVFRQKLPGNVKHQNQLVSVLIPARNEGQSIGCLLSDLLNQNYKHLEIWVFDDDSTDDTAQIVTEFAQKDDRIKLLQSTKLPEGWLGKNFACHSLAQKAKGKWFLFLDADVRTSDQLISHTVSFTEKHELGLLSIFPRQIMKNMGEAVTVPNMNYILLSLLPLVLVRKTKPASVSAANGQFMLFNARVYKSLQPHQTVKTEKVEDIKIARLFKQKNIKTACLAGTSEVRCRMYNNYNQAVDGFSKNVLMYFGNSPALAVLFWAITTLGFLPVLLSFPTTWVVAYLFAFILTRIFVSIISNQNPAKNVLLLIPQQITLGIFIYKALVKKRNKNFKWKGRNIS